MANTIELVHPSAHSSPQSKRQMDRFSRFAQLTAESAYTLQWALLSIRIASSHGGSGHPMWHVMLSAHASPQPKRHLDRFSRLCTDDRGVSLLFTMVYLFPPQNCPFPCWHLDFM